VASLPLVRKALGKMTGRPSESRESFRLVCPGSCPRLCQILAEPTGDMRAARGARGNTVNQGRVSIC
jgi:hypothetical protein